MASSVSELLYNAFIEPREMKRGKTLNFREAPLQHAGDVRKPPESAMKVDPKKEFSPDISAEKTVAVWRKERLGHRRLYADGNVTYKNIQTSSIKESIQLGIRSSVGAMAEKPERDVLMMDFMAVETTSFASDKSEEEPSDGFTFKTYAPVAFRHFRDMFAIKPDAFVSSFCDSDLCELPNPGASGSVFYRTGDDQYVVKTVQRGEAWFLQKLLPGYYLNLHQNPRTLLPKFFGLYCCKRGTKKVRAVVANNVLPSGLRIHGKFDLKGSTQGRSASGLELQKAYPTFKDLDFVRRYPDGIFLEKEVYQALVHTIKRDCRVLESFQIMDYSLLLGVHVVGSGGEVQKGGSNVGEIVEAADGNCRCDTVLESSKLEPAHDKGSSLSLESDVAETVEYDTVHESTKLKPARDSPKPESESVETSNGDGQRYKILESPKLEQSREKSFSLKQGSEVSETADSDGLRDTVLESITLKPARYKSPSPKQVRSRTSLFDKNRALEGLPAKLASGEDLLLFVGIIDILQSFSLKKKMEHAFKSLVHESRSISVHNPAFYSQRFQEFMTSNVFKELPSRRSTRMKQEEKKDGVEKV